MAVKYIFSADSTIRTAGVVEVEAHNTQYFDGFTSAPAYSSGTDPDGTNWVIVNDLTPKKVNYDMTIKTIQNAKSAKFVFDMQCKSCSDAACTSFIETALVSPKKFSSHIITTQQIKNLISTTTGINGKKDDILTFGLTLENPLVVQGIIQVVLPKANINYLDPS